LLAFTTTVHSTRVKRSRGTLNNLYFFAVGAIGTVIGRPDLNPYNVLGDFKACIPNEWLSAVGIQTNDEAQGFSYAQNNNSVIVKFLNFSYSFSVFGKSFGFSIDDIVNKLCSYKDYAIKALGGRRFRRRFIQSPTRKTIAKALRHMPINKRRFFGKRLFLAMKWGWLSKAWNKVKSVASSVVDIAGAIKNKILGAVGGLLKPLFSKIKDFIIGLLDRIPIFKKVRTMLECLRDTARDMANTAKANILGFINAFRTVMTQGWVGFVKVIINTVCNWSVFKRAIIDFVNAFSNSGTTRWKLFGNFAGGLIAAIGGGNHVGRR
jgi:hypothetical protein